MVHTFETFGLMVAEHLPAESTPVDPQHPLATLDVFELCLPPEQAAGLDLGAVEAGLGVAWAGLVEQDLFNRLIVGAHVGWEQALLFRAAFRYLRQGVISNSEGYVLEVLLRYPEFVRGLAELFEARFDPKLSSRTTALEEMRRRVEAVLEPVSRLDEDRILRAFLRFVDSVQRTNWYRRARDLDRFLAFKLDPTQMMAASAAEVETFVYAQHVEGLHVRAGRVARGGIRWSDRPEDFRTEVLGLMRSQTTKNAGIVPDGAKGAFVVRTSLAGLSREAATEEVRRCYSTFLRGLLDVTDNLVDGETVVPPETVVYDGPDTYLVVAADRGTATFSDLANSVAAEYDFWLGDAFASGGSTGFDHKVMGITARGAWLSVRRHLRELGRDLGHGDDEGTDRVVGIGDMSGDVFGNGMLQSTGIQLVGAFDHRHIFLDPDPDPASSYAERQRLFRLPGSSWADYDARVLSAGGGVYDRSAKQIPLNDQTRALLDTEAESLTPAEVIRLLLRARVDLLWNGGVGTYVKGTMESHADAADPANDSVRVDASELRCLIVAEGGNLGLTQAARVEYALSGGRINTDFIDNAAGVNTSDREVNLKILLDSAVRSGQVEAAERDRLLAGLADTVARQVLADSRAQIRAISFAESHAPYHLDRQIRSIHVLRRLGFDRGLALLPDPTELEARRLHGSGLTRPEIAVMLSSAKNSNRTAWLRSEPGIQTGVMSFLEDYFPEPLRPRLADEIRRHPLAREILATRLSSEIMDLGAPGFVGRLLDLAGVEIEDALRTYAVVRNVFGIGDLASRIDEVADHVSWETERTLLRRIHALLEHGTVWLSLRRQQPLDSDKECAHLSETVSAVSEHLESVLPAAMRGERQQEIEILVGLGVPHPTAARVANLRPLAACFDIAEAAAVLGTDPVTTVHYEVGQELRLGWLHDKITVTPGDPHWTVMAKALLRDDLCAAHRDLTIAMLRPIGIDDQKRVSSWLAANHRQRQRHLDLCAEMQGTESPDVSIIQVALQHLRAIARADHTTM